MSMSITCTDCGWETRNQTALHPTSLVTCPQCGSHRIDGAHGIPAVHQ